MIKGKITPHWGEKGIEAGNVGFVGVGQVGGGDEDVPGFPARAQAESTEQITIWGFIGAGQSKENDLVWSFWALDWEVENWGFGERTQMGFASREWETTYRSWPKATSGWHRGAAFSTWDHGNGQTT